MLDSSKKQENFKCVKPLIHKPQFEGKSHCRQCQYEAQKVGEEK